MITSQTPTFVPAEGRFADLAGVLACPDDHEALELKDGYFLCPNCRREFEIVHGTLIDLRPRHPKGANCGNATFISEYYREFQRDYRFDPYAATWGAWETVPAAWAKKRQRQVARVLPLVVNGGVPRFLCDISGGPGYYTLAYASHFHLVLHCDLSVDALNYAMQRAAERRISNVVFLRIDYFSPPFWRSLSRVICLDTLIRGTSHETALLREIRQSLAPTGVALIDFHNWWHNPLRRLHLLRQNFGDNKSYTQSEAEHVLRQAGWRRWEYFPFHQEGTGLLPPTRHMYRIF